MRSTLSSCFEVWLRQCPLHQSLPSLIYWHLWLERNKVIFQSGRSSIHLVLHRTLGCFGRPKAIQKSTVTRCTPPILQESIIVGWFDGATQLHGHLSGARGVLRINEHSIYKWTFNCGSGTNTRAKLLRVWALLTLDSQLHILDLQVFGNSKIIINLLNDKNNLQIITLEQSVYTHAPLIGILECKYYINIRTIFY